MTELVIVIDAELAKCMEASARSRFGCIAPRGTDEWRQDLKEFIDMNHGGQG